MKKSDTSFLFVLPLLAFVIIFILIPIIGTFFNSFFQDISFLSNKFVFLRNYNQLFNDQGFWQAVKFTFLFIAISVPLEIILGLIFALLLNLEIPYRGVLRASVLVPWAIPAAISARTWELIYNYNYGLANFIFLKLGIVDVPAPLICLTPW